MIEREKEVGIAAVHRASRLCVEVQRVLVSEDTLTKGDRSPVTVADYGVQAAVSMALQESFPEDPLVGEEDAAALREKGNEAIRGQVIERVRSICGGVGESEILGAIDRGTHEGGGSGRHWTLDPIDGTKGFLRGQQYAIALALIEDGEVVLGILGCPNLPWDLGDADGSRGCLFSAVRGEGAFARNLGGAEAVDRRMTPDDLTDSTLANFCEPVESAHSSHGDSKKIGEILGVTADPVRIDSQCKYAVLARGDVSIYLRLPTSAEYREKIWDHAGGSLIVAESGGTVTDIHGNRLDFSKGRKLTANQGIVAARSGIHGAVLAAVKEVLG